MEFMAVKDAARLAGMSQYALYRRIRDGEASVLRAGGMYRVPRVEALRLKADREDDLWLLEHGMRVGECAVPLGVCKDTVIKMIREGQLVGRKVANQQYRVHPDDWERYLGSATTAVA